MPKISLSSLKKPAAPQAVPLAEPTQSRFAFTLTPAAQQWIGKTTIGNSAPIRERKLSMDTTGLLDYQHTPTLSLVNSLIQFRSALDASDTGVGKTYMAIAAAREMNLRPLVVCPKAVIAPWREACKYMGVEVIDVLNYEALRGGKKKWLSLVNPPGFERNRARVHKQYTWKVPSDVILIFDEVHRCKGQSSQSCDMLLAAKKQDLHVIGCSATAATNPLEMRAIGFMLGLHKLHDFWRWCRDHGAESGSYGGLHFDRESEGAQKVMYNIHRQIFPARGNRVRIKDLGDKFPESQITAVSYDMGEKSEAIAKAYDEMAAEIAKLAEHTADYSSQIFAIMMAARMKAEMLKVPTLVELTKDALDEDMSVAMFLNFNQSIAAVRERLHDSALIVGGQSQDERDHNIAQFQSDEKRVIIANIAAGGVGISLHDLNGRYPRLSLISPNYSAIQLKQALGRVWRSGGKTKSIQKIVFAAKTIEENAARTVNAKLRNLNLLNDGDLIMGFKL